MCMCDSDDVLRANYSSWNVGSSNQHQAGKLCADNKTYNQTATEAKNLKM